MQWQMPNASGTLALSVNEEAADINGNIDLVKVADNYADDTAAATGGIAIGKMYHTAGVVKIRLT